MFYHSHICACLNFVAVTVTVSHGLTRQSRHCWHGHESVLRAGTMIFGSYVKMAYVYEQRAEYVTLIPSIAIGIVDREYFRLPLAHPSR
ncbi:hypothetical protein BDR03DRAFT_443090 [Suillus americanus]|nr:hypothetical protein BDR03DRAFT_443090 [Suillus americanus]